MFAANSYSPFETGLANAKTVVGLEWIYEGVKNHFGKLLFFVLVVLIGLPVVFFFGYWLQVKRRKFRRRMKRDLPLLNTLEEYLKLKDYITNLDKLAPSLKKVEQYNKKEAPWPLKYTLSQMQKMSSTLLTYNKWQKSRLNCLNTEQFSGSTNVFTFVSERELWAERNTAYQYWM